MRLEKSQQIRNETQIVPKMLAMLNHFFLKKKKRKSTNMLLVFGLP